MINRCTFLNRLYDVSTLFKFISYKALLSQKAGYNSTRRFEDVNAKMVSIKALSTSAILRLPLFNLRYKKNDE